MNEKIINQYKLQIKLLTDKNIDLQQENTNLKGEMFNLKAELIQIRNELEQAKTNSMNTYINYLEEEWEVNEIVKIVEEELERRQNKINKATGYANERINYCCHNEIDATDWEEMFDILNDNEILGDKE